MHKYWALYKAGLQNALAYRGPMVVWKITNILSFITIVYVWLSSNSMIIGGYAKSQLITYYIFVLFLQWLITFTPVMNVKEEIKSGDINSKIIKPFSYLWQMLALESSWHTISPLIGTIGLTIMLIFFRNYFEFNFNLSLVLLLIPILPLSAMVCFFMSFSFGLLAFWFTEVDGLVSLFWLMLFLFGGQGIPLSFFSGVARQIVNFLPFRYIYSFPLEVIFNKLSPLEITVGFLAQIVWVLVLYFLARILWQKGIKVYGAYGG